MLKEQKGITLVALIITIIVMLILAGVSISLVVGEGGVLKQAQEAGEKTSQAEVKQAIQLAFADIMAAYYGDTSENKDTKVATYYKAAEVQKAIRANGATTAEVTTDLTNSTTTFEVKVGDLKYTVTMSTTTSGRPLAITSIADPVKVTP